MQTDSAVMEEVLKICRKQSLMVKYKILTTLKHKSFRPKSKNIKMPNCAENHSETLEKKSFLPIEPTILPTSSFAAGAWVSNRVSAPISITLGENCGCAPFLSAVNIPH